MWRDDIAEMVSLFGEATSDGKVKTQTETYELSDLDDLAQIGTACVDHVIVTADQGRLRLELGPRECWVEVTDPDLKARGMLAEVVRLSKRHKRFGAQFRYRVLTMAAAAWPWRTVSRTLLIEGAGKVQRTILYTRTRAEAPTFWMRKREDIWIEISVSVISLIIGALMGYWINTIT
jgi:hypothetical protein